MAEAFTPILEVILQLIDKVYPLDFILDNHVYELSEAIFDTLHMMIIPGFISLFFGIVFGVIFVVVKLNGILENKYIYFIVDKFMNFFRSVPFVILIGFLMGLSRLIMNTAIGVEGMYIPLIFGTVPFMARQVESALSEVDEGLIEASIAMGCSPLDIILRVYIKESIPSIARGTTITFISLIGLIAMAGGVGAGGLGNFALRYGYQRKMFEATLISIVIILVIVSFIQAIGNYIAKKTTH
ncbi:MAG: ABC transporter permease subunit [Erysipelotrichia bacterium]|nr:ABC transporter permease subunit [Erysipelotrichia bacterium]NCC54863.1 ABC transporter permease subunit [Erysipelotrichia bacterium]